MSLIYFLSFCHFLFTSFVVISGLSHHSFSYSSLFHIPPLSSLCTLRLSVSSIPLVTPVSLYISHIYTFTCFPYQSSIFLFATSGLSVVFTPFSSPFSALVLFSWQIPVIIIIIFYVFSSFFVSLSSFITSRLFLIFFSCFLFSFCESHGISLFFYFASIPRLCCLPCLLFSFSFCSSPYCSTSSEFYYSSSPSFIVIFLLLRIPVQFFILIYFTSFDKFISFVAVIGLSFLFSYLFFVFSQFCFLPFPASQPILYPPRLSIFLLLSFPQCY